MIMNNIVKVHINHHTYSLSAHLDFAHSSPNTRVGHTHKYSYKYKAILLSPGFWVPWNVSECPEEDQRKRIKKPVKFDNI